MSRPKRVPDGVGGLFPLKNKGPRRGQRYISHKIRRPPVGEVVCLAYGTFEDSSVRRSKDKIRGFRTSDPLKMTTVQHFGASDPKIEARSFLARLDQPPLADWDGVSQVRSFFLYYTILCVSTAGLSHENIVFYIFLFGHCARRAIVEASEGRAQHRCTTC